MEVYFEPGDGLSLLYESVIEEIALEGLTGITLPALFTRLADREDVPINSEEDSAVRQSIWASIRTDSRLTFFLLPEEREQLRIWNRNACRDQRGNLEEPSDAPTEIYNHNGVEIKGCDESAEELKVRGTRLYETARKKKLKKEDVRRISLYHSQGDGELVIDGLRFSMDEAEEANPSKGRKNEACFQVKRTWGVETVPGGVVAMRGSSAEFHNREDITDRIRREILSYEQVLGNWRSRLVIVASQFVRESLLFQRSNQHEVNVTQYCVVERVGRARRYGEQARGKISLARMGIDAKNLFYLRKTLLAEGIISKQPLVMRFGDSRSTGTLISVFHLPHFFCREDPPENIKVRKIFAYVYNAEKNYVDFFKLQNIFGKYIMRVIADEYRDFVRVEEVPYGLVYRDEVDSIKDLQKKEALANRKLRVLTLRDKNLTLSDLILKQLSWKSSQEEDEGESQIEIRNSGKGEEDATFDWAHCCVPEKELAHESELVQFLRLIEKRGPKGLTQDELSSELMITPLDSRSAMRYLSRWKIANTHMEDIGKTKVTRWTYFKYEPKKEKSIEHEDEDEEEDENESDHLTDASSPVKPFIWKSRKTLHAPRPEHDANTVHPYFRFTKQAAPEKGKKSTVDSSEENVINVKVPVRDDELLDRRVQTQTQVRVQPPPEDPLALRTEESSKRKRKRNLKEEFDFTLVPFAAKRKRVRDKMVDDVDIKVNITKDRQRAAWSPEEDRAVLYLYIASVLVIPKYNWDRVFVYNAVQMRNILHRRVPSTQNKMSGVVRRRVHTLLKSPSLYNKYRTMLEISLRDEDMYVNYIEPHLPPPTLNVYTPIPDSALESLFGYLEEKFDRQLISSTSLQAQIVANARDLEVLLDNREIRRMNDMWVDVLGNMFQQFYRKTLSAIVPVNREAEKQLALEGITIEDEGPRWVLPYVPRPVTPEEQEPQEDNETCLYSEDQLDYLLAFATTFLETADEVMVNDAFGSSSSSEEEADVHDQFHLDRRPTILRKMKERGRFSSDLCCGERSATSDSEVFLWKCRTIFMSVLMGGGGTPDSLRAYMNEIPDRTLDRIVASVRRNGIFSMKKPNRRIVLTDKMKRKLTNHLHPNTFRTANTLLRNVREGTTNISLYKNVGAAYFISDFGPLSTIHVEIPLRIISIKEAWREDYDNILASSDEEFKALRLLRLQLNAEGDRGGKIVEKDFFDVNIPKVVVSQHPEVPSSVRNAVFGEDDNQTEKYFLQGKLLEFIEFDEDEGTIGPGQLNLAHHSHLYDIINVTGEIGVSMSFLKQHYRRKDLKVGLRYLLNHGYVYLVGIKHRKFVAVRHMKNWSVLTSPDTETGESPRRIVSRSWVDAHGEVNWKLMDRIIVGVLGMVSRNSHVMTLNIAKSLCPLISYVDVFVVLSALFELKMVDMFRIPKRVQKKRLNLFSCWKDQGMENDEETDDLEAPYKIYGIDALLDFERAWVEIRPFAASKYARIQAMVFPLPEGQFNEEDEEFDLEDVEIVEEMEDPGADSDSHP